MEITVENLQQLRTYVARLLAEHDNNPFRASWALHRAIGCDRQLAERLIAEASRTTTDEEEAWMDSHRA